MSATFSVEIKECSKELSARERIMLKDVSNANKLDTLVNESSFTFKPVAYAVLGIHNEKSDNKDYENYVIIGEDGTKYVTGSPSFWNSFTEIWDEMKDAGEDFEIEVYKLDSKNYKGKQFLTCSIV